MKLSNEIKKKTKNEKKIKVRIQNKCSNQTIEREKYNKVNFN